jgi:hypothetical protein
LSELVDYRKIHRHCNVPTSYKENSLVFGSEPKGIQVVPERKEIAYHPARIQELESLGFEWNGTSQPSGRPFEQASADFAKKHGHQTFLKSTAKPQSWASGSNPKVSIQVARRRKEIAHDPESRIGAWVSSMVFLVTAWEDRLSDIVDRKVYRHCNVSRSYSENHWLIGL